MEEVEGSCSEPFGVSEVYSNNESTAGADASVEVSNNITNKATSNSLYTHLSFLQFYCRQNIGKLKEWVMIDHDCC